MDIIASNLMSDIISYFKRFGEKGKLTSFVGKLSDCYDNALGEAYEWACESTDNVRRYGFNYFKHQFKNYVVNDFTRNKRGLIYVERSIDIDMTTGLDELSFKSVGECWSWKRHNARSYCANFSLLNNHICNVVLCGYVNPEDIDWVETIYLNSYDWKTETEIRMAENAHVEVSYVKINTQKYALGGSYLLDASPDKYSKNKNNLDG